MSSLSIEFYNRILTDKNEIAKDVLSRHFAVSPSLKAKYKQFHIDHYIQDTEYTLTYLAESAFRGEPGLFIDYMKWCKIFFASINLIDEEMYRFFDLLGEKLLEIAGDSRDQVLYTIYSEGLEVFDLTEPGEASYIDPDAPLGQVAAGYLQDLISGDRRSAVDKIMEAQRSGATIKEIYEQIFKPVMWETGRLWHKGEISVAHEHFITAVTQLSMSQLYPYLFSSDNRKNRAVIVACVPNELHEIGARMIADFFEMEGWDSYFYGANTPTVSVLKAITEYNVEVLALSATMTLHIPKVAELINALRISPETAGVKIIVGGYPFNLSDGLWRKIGADGYAASAQEGIRLAEQLTFMEE